MTKILWNSLLLSPAVLGAALIVSGSAIAAESQATSEASQPEAAQTQTPAQQLLAVESTPTTQSTLGLTPVTAPEQQLVAQQVTPANPAASSPAASDTEVLRQLNQYSSENSNRTQGQVTSVSQLRDVQPTDWAFQALQNLVERYGCIAGYPDRTYRGNRALTRYEFAAGLNACLEQVVALIQPGGIGEEDLATLRRLQEEFAAELATLRGRVDALEVRTAELEANQFSTTTKLRGESIFAITGGNGETALGDDFSSEPAVGTRTRLNFDTSFTGRDLLRTRLQVATLDSFSSNTSFTPMGDLFFDAGVYQEGDTTFRLDSLLYSTSIGPAQVVFMANNGAADDFATTIVPLDGDGGSGALSRFGTRPPIYNYVNGTGIGLRTNLGPAEVSLGYLVPSGNASDPRQGNGMVNGPYAGIAQVVIKPGPLRIGLTYVNAYRTDMQTGSTVATPVSTFDFTTITNAYGVEVGLNLGRLAIGGWAGYSNQNVRDVGLKGDLETWNWAVQLGLPDLGKPGSLLGLIVGMEPRVTQADGALEELFEDPDTGLHIEGFYQFQLTDNISITPGVIWLTAPDHVQDNEDIVIGTIRTTFSF